MSARPLGVTLLSILQLLSSLFYLVTGALVIIAALPMGWPAWVIGGIIGILFAIVGVIGLLLFYGLWILKSWAWFWTMAANILGIIFSISNLWQNIFSIILSVIIVVYLLMPGIKDHFK